MRQSLSFGEHSRRGNASDNQALAVIVACTGGRPGPRLRSSAARRR